MNVKNETMGILAQNEGPESSSRQASVKSAIFVALAAWLGLDIFLGARGAFAAAEGAPPVPIFIGLAIPLAAFIAAYLGWKPFRALILGADLRFVAAIQAWRWAGQEFFWLYAWGVLPGLFAFPAGLGDMAIGVSAPWIVLRLVRDPSFAASRRFVTWNLLGIFDFVVAVSTAVLSSGLFHGITEFNGNLTTSAMAKLPLVLIPAFVVPFFTMLHLTALFQARQLARSGKFVSAADR